MRYPRLSHALYQRTKNGCLYKAAAEASGRRLVVPRASAPPVSRKVAGQNFHSFKVSVAARSATTYTMDSTAAETKLQIRLSTRDPGLQIAEEPTVLLVQTCKSTPSAHTWAYRKVRRKDKFHVLRIYCSVADVLL